jgi:hypothetical protein
VKQFTSCSRRPIEKSGILPDFQLRERRDLNPQPLP